MNLIGKYILFSLCIICSVSPSTAQWIENGVPLFGNEDSRDKVVLADEDGGAWIAWTSRYNLAPSAYINHIDRDGYKAFGEDGIPLFVADSLGGWTGYLMGLEKSIDGSVIAATYGPDEHFRAQRISREGELLFGPTGRLLSEERCWIISEFPNWTCSDGAGGIWVLIQHWNWDGAYLVGVNADGTLKSEDGDILVTDDRYTSYDPWMLSNSEGIACCWGLENDEYYIRRFSLDGVPTTPARCVVVDGSYGFPKIYASQNSDDYYFFKFPYLQRVTADLDSLWGSRGVRPFDGMQPYSYADPLPLPNGNVAICGLQWGRLHFNLIDENGQHVYEEPFQLLWTGNHRPGPYYLFDLHPDSSSIFICSIHGAYNSNILVSLISLEGENLWSDDHVLLFTREELRPWIFSAAVCSDGSVIVAATLNEGNVSYLFKVTQDGRVAGQPDQSVGNADLIKPEAFDFHSAYPNPFNAELQLDVTVGDQRTYGLKIYDLRGRLVASRSYHLEDGSHTLSWRPKHLGSGVYFLQWETDHHILVTKKIMYLK